MIYLIGVNHAVQDYRWSDKEWSKNREHREVYAKLIEEFKACLKNVIKDYEITVLAEEYNEEALLDVYDKSVLKDIAESLCLPHIYCDPNRTERKKFRIYTNKEREQFWFDKIKMHIDGNMLFIVGACHIRSFSDLIERNKCEVSIRNEDWKKEKFPIYSS